MAAMDSIDFYKSTETLEVWVLTADVRSWLESVAIHRSRFRVDR